MQELLHNKILHDISGGIVYVNGGKISYVNPAAEYILNKTSAEMISKPFAQIFIEYEENDEFNQIILDSIFDFSNQHENIVQYFDGENFKFLHIKTSILYDGLRKMGILLLIDDITELMNLRGLELDLKRLKDLNQQLQDRNRQLKKESEIDKLTGLFNKKTMENFCARHLKFLPQNQIAALIIVDLDHFKEANDTYGHQTGDIILTQFANFVGTIFKENSYVGRFGGDEFVILMKNPPSENFIAEKAAEILQAARNIFVEGMEIKITASVGVAVVSTAAVYEKVFATADNALYFVKEHGRDNFHIARF